MNRPNQGSCYSGVGTATGLLDQDWVKSGLVADQKRMGLVHLVIQDGMRLFVVMKWHYHTVADYPIKYEQISRGGG